MGMQQVIFIHGGMIHPSQEALYELIQEREYNPLKEKKRWKSNMAELLWEKYQWVALEMLGKDMASYKIWKLWFEKTFEHLQEEVILVGHSLGAMFLIKYLGENSFPKKITQLHLVATVLDDLDMPAGETYLGDFAYSSTLIKKIEKKADQIFLYHSKDDQVVPFHHSERIKAELPSAQFFVFEERGHFNHETFPELVMNIKGE